MGNLTQKPRERQVRFNENSLHIRLNVYDQATTYGK